MASDQWSVDVGHVLLLLYVDDDVLSELAHRRPCCMRHPLAYPLFNDCRMVSGHSLVSACRSVVSL